MNEELTDTVAALDGVLAATHDVDNYFDLDQLSQPIDLDRLGRPEASPQEHAFIPDPPRGLSRMLGGNARFEEEVRAGRVRFQQALAEHNDRERARAAAVREAHQASQQRARIQQTWPWAHPLAAAFARLAALPVPAS